MDQFWPTYLWLHLPCNPRPRNQRMWFWSTTLEKQSHTLGTLVDKKTFNVLRMWSFVASLELWKNSFQVLEELPTKTHLNTSILAQQKFQDSTSQSNHLKKLLFIGSNIVGTLPILTSTSILSELTKFYPSISHLLFPWHNLQMLDNLLQTHCGTRKLVHKGPTK